MGQEDPLEKGYRLPTPVFLGFPGGSDRKESACNVRPGFNPWFGKIPWRKEWLPTPVFWPGEFHEVYSPWSRKESGLSDFHFSNSAQTWSVLGTVLGPEVVQDLFSCLKKNQ